MQLVPYLLRDNDLPLAGEGDRRGRHEAAPKVRQKARQIIHGSLPDGKQLVRLRINTFTSIDAGRNKRSFGVLEKSALARRRNVLYAPAAPIFGCCLASRNRLSTTKQRPSLILHRPELLVKPGQVLYRYAKLATRLHRGFGRAGIHDLGTRIKDYPPGAKRCQIAGKVGAFSH